MNQKEKIIVGISTLLFIGGLLLYWLFLHQPDDFHQGRDKVCNGQYAEAIPVLKAYLKKHPKAPQASRASFFLAKAYLGLGESKRAKAIFISTIKTYPDSLEAHKSEYKIALIDLLTGKTEDALEGFTSLAQTPNGPLAPEAKAMAGYLNKQM